MSKQCNIFNNVVYTLSKSSYFYGLTLTFQNFASSQKCRKFCHQVQLTNLEGRDFSKYVTLLQPQQYIFAIYSHSLQDGVQFIGNTQSLQFLSRPHFLPIIAHFLMMMII